MFTTLKNKYKLNPNISLKSIIPFLIYFLIIFLIFVLPFKGIISYSIVFIASSLIFILLCRYIFKSNLDQKVLLFLIIAGIILRISLMFVYPAASDDFYRYIWDGKVLSEGINPYQYAPADEELYYLHSETLPEKINFNDYKTVYPPVSLGIFYIAYLIGGETFWGIKILLLIFEFSTIIGIALIIKKLRLPDKNILIYLLAPLPLFEFFINAHSDGFGLTLLVFSIFFYLSNKKNISYILIGLTICIKPLALILLPILFINEKRISEKIKSVIIPLLVSVFIYLPFTFSSNVFESLTRYTLNWTFNGFIFESINLILNDNQTTRMICAILYLIIYLIIILSDKNFLNKIYLAFIFLFIFSPVVHPWYVNWLALLIPFIPRWSGIFFISLISLTSITVINYQLFGIWKSYPVIMLIEYLPVIFLLIYEMWDQKYSNRIDERFY